MKWIETRVVFESENTGPATELITHIFYELGVKGVVIETPENEAAGTWAEDAPPRADDYAVSGYFPKNDQTEDNLRILEEELSRLEQENHIRCRISCREIDEKDWAESWKAYFRPERISEKIVVKPSWRDYTPKQDDIVIEIDPGMAFGTGTHPTTSLCVRMIEKYLQPGDTLLDVGCGSGILMLAAAKLGAGMVHGTDNDPMAVEIAEKNLLLNHIDADKFSAFESNLIKDVHQPYDMVVSNILANVIMELLEEVKRVFRQKGIIICSGFTIDSKKKVEKRMEEEGFVLLDSEANEDWAVLVGRLPAE